MIFFSVTAFDAVLEHGKTAKGIISISLRFPASKLIDDSVQKVWDDGFTVAVAAANENTDACFTSPQRVKDVSRLIMAPFTLILLTNMGNHL